MNFSWLPAIRTANLVLVGITHLRILSDFQANANGETLIGQTLTPKQISKLECG